MLNNLFIFIVSLFLVIKGATMATKYAARLAENFHLSKYTIGFIIVAVVSILPEGFIAINAALEGVPSFGLGTLLGSNVADLTLVFAIIVFFAKRNLHVESKILKNNLAYPVMLFLPIILGFNGHFSRIEGLVLVLVGAIFYYTAIKNGTDSELLPPKEKSRLLNFFLLLLSMIILLTGAHFVVTSATALAKYWGINSILIGMLVVGLGTTIPELFFSLQAVKKKDDSLAIGDILGTVLADATILVGVLAMIKPFFFPSKIIYSTGVFMVVAAFLLFHFIKSEYKLTKKEAYFLLIFWIVFAFTELLINN